MLAYLKLIRIPNLTIVAILQAVLYFGILKPVFAAFGIGTVLNENYFVLFILTTLILTAAGYIINDILDVKADEINKPGKYVVGKDISEKKAYIYYIVMLITGLAISFIIAIHINKIHYIIIYLIAVALLYLYSKYFKKQFLCGNIFVSIFSAFVPGIILVFEFPGLVSLYKTDYSSFEFVMDIFIGFMAFSFFVSFYRELVKDMEDIEGDIIIKAKTFPVVLGIEMTKLLSGIISIIILILLFYWLKMDINYDKNYLKIYVLLFVVIPLFYSVFLLKKAETKFDFNKLSKVIKVIMVSGISILFFYL